MWKFDTTTAEESLISKYTRSDEKVFDKMMKKNNTIEKINEQVKQKETLKDTIPEVTFSAKERQKENFGTKDRTFDNRSCWFCNVQN